jgi:hypothetical protein
MVFNIYNMQICAAIADAEHSVSHAYEYSNSLDVSVTDKSLQIHSSATLQTSLERAATKRLHLASFATALEKLSAQPAFLNQDVRSGSAHRRHGAVDPAGLM